jgi:3-methyladenine DNA glycosylase AlkD
MTHSLIDAIVMSLEAQANPDKAEQQQRYMKSSIPFYGVTVPEVRRITKAAMRDHPVSSREDFESTVRALWDNVRRREEWYAALTIATAPRHRRFIDARSLPLFRHLIESGAWWDVVDDVATHLVSPLVVSSRASGSHEISNWMRKWAHEDNIWIARTAVLCQVGAKTDLDSRLLADVIEPNLASKEFFLRKAIGWALRDYARTDPDWVRRYVEDHRGALSGLSIREASKHL